MPDSTVVELSVSRGPGAPKGRPKPAGSGRRPGVKNLVTREIRVLAGKYSLRAVRQTWKLAQEAKDQVVQLKALELLLAYAHGRPNQTQLIGGDGGHPIRTDGLRPSDPEFARRLALMFLRADEQPEEAPVDGRPLGHVNGANGAQRTPDGPGESPDDKFEVGLVLDLPEKATATLVASDRAGIGDWRVLKADGTEVRILPGVTAGEVREWASMAAPKGRLS